MLLLFGESVAFKMTPLLSLPGADNAFFSALSCLTCAYFGFTLTKMLTHCVGLKQ